MPGRGGFGQSGGTFNGGTGDETRSGENVQNGGKLSATTAVPDVVLLSTVGTENQDRDATDENASSDTQDSNTPPGFSENGEAGGMQPPEMAGGADSNMTPPDLPQNGAAGDSPFDLPQGNMPDASQNGDADDGTQFGIPQGGWNFGGRMDGGNMRTPTGNMPWQENASQAADAGTPISAETLLLLGISAIVLLAGCIVAACYKRRG